MLSIDFDAQATVVNCLLTDSDVFVPEELAWVNRMMLLMKNCL